MACPVPAAWCHGSPQLWGQCLPAPRRAVPREALQHPSTDMSVVHPCPAEGTRMLRPSRLCRPRGGKGSCQAGCSIQFALISQSASGSHAPKPISAAVAGPKGALPSPCPGLGPGRGPPEPPTAARRRGAKPSPRRAGRGAVRVAPLSQSRGGTQHRPRSVPKLPKGQGTRGLCAGLPRGRAARLAAHMLPSHGLWVLKLLLAAGKSPAGRGLGQPTPASTKLICAAWGMSHHPSPPPQPGAWRRGTA